MREFVYVSDGKLQQFLPKPSRLMRPSAIRLTTPLGGLDVEPGTPGAERGRLQHLERVDKHLNSQADWFADPELRPGRWVWFEAPLRFITLRGAYQHLVLFADPAPGEDPAHEQETGCRLLMHGSARHLLGYAPVTIDGPPLEGIEGGSSIGTTFLTTAGHVVQALSLEHNPAADSTPPPSLDLSGAGVRHLVDALDARHEQAGSAALMHGYARVTSVLPATDSAQRLVVASPLTVEYAYNQS
ncbi:SAVMC3_10250 family protein [Streptomyces rubrogriseus]|uniref:SAVMC3_10250 family protein n=1 Tax=Streptomyces rubrogriseus TaxID=194673 RepID=UPI000D58E7CD|nr:SAVMC3_10250 family protein [Streptomyces rubrogriseus]